MIQLDDDTKKMILQRVQDCVNILSNLDDLVCNTFQMMNVLEEDKFFKGFYDEIRSRQCGLVVELKNYLKKYGIDTGDLCRPVSTDEVFESVKRWLKKE